MVSMFMLSNDLGAFTPKCILGAFAPIFKLGGFSPRLCRWRKPGHLDDTEPDEFDTNLTSPANNSGRPRRPRACDPSRHGWLRGSWGLSSAKCAHSFTTDKFLSFRLSLI